MKQLTLDIAICTHRPEGIARLAASGLPRMPRVSYVISWQDHRDMPVPDELLRDDITVHRLDSARGLSLNRNNALAHCTSDLILISDDDITYRPDAIGRIIDLFGQNPGLDFATFIAERIPNSVVYPASSCPLSLPLPRGYSVTSMEIAMRRSSCSGLRFIDELGLGAPVFGSGEEEVLLLTAIRSGLDCRFFPITICEHHHPTTALAASLSPAVLKAFGLVIALYYPTSWLLRVPLKAFRLARARQARFFNALRHLASGALAAPALRRRHNI